jgi:16S rRNA (guanine527-N7)-methyltransferase
MTLPNAPYDPAEIVRLGSVKLGISLTDRAVERMLIHMRMVQEWNVRVDLTSLIDPAGMAVRHYLDSLTLLKVFPHIARARVLDIGTGAGFPGLVLACAIDSLELMLLDRDPSKIVFLKHVVKHLALSRVRFLNMALGPVLQDACQYSCDVVVSRAFSPDAELMDSCHVLLEEGGLLARMTGPGSPNEPLALKHFKVADQWEGLLPFSDRFRRVILYKKSREP